MGLSVRTLPGYVIVELPAEIDFDNADTVREQLLKVLNLGASGVIVDMSEVRFCDSTGVSALLRIHRRAEALGAWVRVVAGTPQVREVFRVLRVAAVLPVYPTVGEAMADSAAGAPP